VGLALAFYDMLTCGEGKIKWGDGLVWHKSMCWKDAHGQFITADFPPATFRLTVFAPIEGEVIVGTVHSSNVDHIRGNTKIRHMPDWSIDSYISIHSIIGILQRRLHS
jgi:hypothetical protein